MSFLPTREESIPKCRGDTEVTGVPRMMMFGMTTLGAMQVRAGMRTPVMDGMMYQDIPEIPEDESGRQAACQIESNRPPKRQEHAPADQGGGQPGRRTNHGGRHGVV